MAWKVSVAIWLVGAGGVIVSRIFKALGDDRTEDLLAWLRGRVHRGQAAVTAHRIAFARTVHLQQARMTLDPFELGPADLEGLDRLNNSWLRKAARSEIAELAAALSATETDPDNPGRDRALACYDAAALLVAERDDRLDLIGAIVLAREGQTALADRDPHPLPVCQVHPLHGPALRRPARGQRFRPPRKLPAVCAECKGCSILERDKRALLAGDVPYYRTAGFWASVGFGALDLELPTRVLEYLGVE